MAHRSGVSVEGELGCLGSLERGNGEKEDGHGAEGKLDARSAAHRSRRGRASSSREPASTRWPSPSAPATARTSSRASPPAKCWRWIASRRSTRTAAELPPGDARLELACRRSCKTIINKYGGKIKQTWGVPVEEIQRGIKHGVRKINVDTDNRLAITGAIRKVFAEKPEKFDPRDYLKPARDAMKKVCVERMTPSARPARLPTCPIVTLDQMVARLRGRQVRRERQAGRSRHAPQGQGRRRVRDGALDRPQLQRAR